MGARQAEVFGVKVFTFNRDYGVVGQASSRAGVIRVARQFVKENLKPGARVGWEMQVHDPGTPFHGRGIYTGEFTNK